MAHGTMRLSRRDLMRLAPLLGSALVARPVACLAAEPNLRETADLITGPFYPLAKPHDVDADLTLLRGHRDRASGQIIQLSGRVMTLRGEPVRGAVIEVWQANARGRYSHPSDPNIDAPLDPNFQGYARIRTDREGQYRLTTIKPGAYATARGDMRAPHIHFAIDAIVDRKVTQLFFPDEPLNAEDRHLNSVRRPETLTARLNERSGTVLTANWDIVLHSG